MNREAASLGVKVYSIFRGKTGAVDRHLSEAGRLRMIESPEEINEIKLEKRPSPKENSANSRETLNAVVNAISELAQEGAGKSVKNLIFR